MAGNFSIDAGALAAIGICIKLGLEIHQIQKDIGSIDEELNTLGNDIEGMKDLFQTMMDTYNRRQSDAVLDTFERDETTEKHWVHLETTLKNCLGVMKKLDLLVDRIRGNSSASGPSKIDAIGKAIRKRLKEKELSDCRAQLSSYQRTLQIILGLITQRDVGMSRNHNAQTVEHLESLGQNIQSQMTNIQQSIMSRDGLHYDQEALVALKDLQESVKFAMLTIKAVSTNQHFDIPQPVSSIFTGRDSLLQELREYFIPKRGISHEQSQRRFIIQGIDGSGKTQFCCKFAQDNRDSFWGVFWIDASTPERIKQTLGTIAETAGLQKSERSALHWLSNLEQNWLLIIDNADNETVPIENYFPKGNRGNILVTTTNPAYKIHGNVGRRSYEFSGLDVDEATQLLLKASNAPAPWDATCKTLALKITTTLGSLALAIIHAGAAIRNELCGLKDYLAYYKRFWRRIRSSKLSATSLASDIKIYATWEMCHSKLEQRGTEASFDALELLSMMAFLHWEAIPREIFSRALRNPEREGEQESNEPLQPSALKLWSTVSIGQIREMPRTLLALLLRNKSPAALPRFIRDVQRPGDVDDADYRVRCALNELVQMSLIIRNEHSDSYAMHPLVHTWARERPKVKLAEQALWADITGRVLAASILLPPLGISSADEKYHVSLLPHVEHVQSHRQSIAEAISAGSHSRNFAFVSSWITTLLPILSPDTDKTRMYAKFSLVYAKCGDWKHAEELLKQVTDFLCQYLGPQHKRSRQALLFLSSIYWELGRPDDAAKLQDSVFKTCESHLGPLHLDTLKAKGQLGRTRWQQGQFTEARGHQELVLRGLRQTLPPDDPDVLEAMDDLGLTVLKFWKKQDIEKAMKLHYEAAAGMAKVHGQDHERTLFANEHYCRAVVLLGGEHVESTQDIMVEVLETRRAKLGKKHSFTLRAMANMAIVLTAVGQLEQAEELARQGIPMAEETLGPDHIGTLYGRQILACILVQRRQYAEAEEILVEISEKQKHMAAHRGDYHPDRLGTLIELAHCTFALGKIDRAIAICEEAIRGFETITTEPHPLAMGMQNALARLIELRSNGVVDYLSEQHCRDYDTLFPFTYFKPSS